MERWRLGLVLRRSYLLPRYLMEQACCTVFNLIGVKEALGTHSRVSMASYTGTPMDQGCQLEDEAVLNGRATALVVHDGCEVVGWLVSTVPIGL